MEKFRFFKKAHEKLIILENTYKNEDFTISKKSNIINEFGLSSR